MIPRRLVRTVPALTGAATEARWGRATALHPDWLHVTLRDPIDRDGFPITAIYWDSCETGAQLADLVRAEDLYWRGGIYLDSDVEVIRRLDPLLGLDGFAAWEDPHYIPNAVLGFTPKHPALLEVLRLAIERHGQGTWAAGVGVTTEVFRGRDDMALLPPGSFYPIDWRTAHRHGVDPGTVADVNPWSYAIHLYAGSWKKAPCG